MQFKSVTLQKYVSAENGGGSNVTVSRDIPSSWETFRVGLRLLLSLRFICCSYTSMFSFEFDWDNGTLYVSLSYMEKDYKIYS